MAHKLFFKSACAYQKVERYIPRKIPERRFYVSDIIDGGNKSVAEVLSNSSPDAHFKEGYYGNVIV